MLEGVYTYDIPESITRGIEGVFLRPITEAPQSYVSDPHADSVSLLIARQGAVNEMLKSYPNVRWLQLLNAGYEKVDLNLLRDRNILFTNARSVYCATIAEDVLAKILFLSKCYAVHLENQRVCFWPTDEQLGNDNLDLMGRKLCILGAGEIGREIALRARAFGLEVLGFDPYVKAQEGFDRVVSDRNGLQALLTASDYVVTSLPVTPETRDMVDERMLSFMKRDAFLINVARGEIIDEAALVRALNRGELRGAAIDVAKREPLPKEDPLWTAKNLLITPHRAAYGDQMKRHMNALIERNIRHYLKNEVMEDRVI
ncbi:MAG: D-2-hydroxyacid dehydrogenase [Clostridia bacterium]